MKTNIRKYASAALLCAFSASAYAQTSIDADTTLEGDYADGIYLNGDYKLTVDSTVNIGAIADGDAISSPQDLAVGYRYSITITENGTLNIDGDWNYSPKSGYNSGSSTYSTSLTIADEGELNILSGTTQLFNKVKVSGTINVSTDASLTLRTSTGNSGVYASSPSSVITFYDGSELNFGTFDENGNFTESSTAGSIVVMASVYKAATGITILDNDVLKGVTLETMAGSYNANGYNTGYFYLGFEAVDGNWDELTGDDYQKTTGTVYAGILELNNYNTIVVDLFEKEDNDLIIIEDITFATDSSSLTNDVVSTSISFNITDFESGLLQLGIDTDISIEVHSDSYYLVITDDDDAVHYIALSATDADGNEISGFELDASNILSSIVVPEPSTYAMVFGLLALGFACYRKRK